MDSPFSLVLDTNYIPTDAEARQIQNLLSQPISSISRLDSEISRMQAIIKDMSLTRDKLRNYVVSHRALLSPVRRLPPEVVAEIFVHCLPTNHNALMSIGEAPLLLGRICRTWRDISISMPQLWCSLHVVIPLCVIRDPLIEDPSIEDTSCQSMKNWFARSGNLPLSISVMDCSWPRSSNNFDPPKPKKHPLIETLVQLSHRWKSLGLNVSSLSLKPMLALTADDVPLLESIKTEERRAKESLWSQCTFLRTARRLNNVSIRNVRRVSSLPFALPWAQLTRLSLKNWSSNSESCSVSELLDILRQCSKLESCTSNICADPSNPPNLSPVVLPVLQHLRIFAFESDDNRMLARFFDLLIMPELCELQVSVKPTTPSSREEPHLHFLSVLTRRSYPLEKLSLGLLAISEDELIEFLQVLPSLRVLVIGPPGEDLSADNHSETTLHDRILRLLSPTKVSPDSLCPSLTTVKFTFGKHHNFSEDALLDFINSRWQPVHPGIARLESVEISFNKGQSDFEAQFKAFRLEGLDLSVTYSGCPRDSESSCKPRVLYLPGVGLQDEGEWE